MKKNILFFIFFIIIYNLSFSQKLPELTGRVVDKTGILTNNQISELENILKKYEEETKHQMAIVIIPTLEGYSIEEYSIKLAEKWKIGRKDFDDGIIMLISIGDRKIRIEVGYGLEESLTDAKAFLIIERIIKPAFRNGDYYTGIRDAVYAMAKVTGATVEANNITEKYSNATKDNFNNYSKYSTERKKNSPFIGIIIGIFFAIFIKGFSKTSKKKGKNLFRLITSIFISITALVLFAAFLNFSVFVFLLITFVITLFILSTKTTTSSGSTYYHSGGWFDTSSSNGGWFDSDNSFGSDSFSGGGGDFGGGGASGDW